MNRMMDGENSKDAASIMTIHASHRGILENRQLIGSFGRFLPEWVFCDSAISAYILEAVIDNTIDSPEL